MIRASFGKAEAAFLSRWLSGAFRVRHCQHHTYAGVAEAADVFQKSTSGIQDSPVGCAHRTILQMQATDVNGIQGMDYVTQHYEPSRHRRHNARQRIIHGHDWCRGCYHDGEQDEFLTPPKPRSSLIPTNHNIIRRQTAFRQDMFP